MMLRGDVEGRVPFSLVAVIALLLAGVSSVYVATTAREASDAEVRIQELRVLGSVAEAVHHGVEMEANGLALEAIKAAADGPWDPRRANEAFMDLVRARLVPSFPRTARGFTIELDGFRAALVLQPLRTLDALPSGRVVPEDGFGYLADAIDTARPATFGETGRTPYFSLVGTANYTVHRREWALRAGFPLTATVDSPFPLLQSAADEFRTSSEGSRSELGRIVRYILTTAAQFRALQGVGVERYGEPGTTTADLLSPRDVEVAVNLALLLEELRRFRDVDDRSAILLDARHYARRAGQYLGWDLLPGAPERTMERLLDAYARGGSTDPADLFALYSAFDAEPLRLNRVLAQALSALMDQGVLRVLEYFGIEWVIDLGITHAETLVRDIEGFLSWITGESREGQLVKEYVRGLFGMAGEATTMLGPVPVVLPPREYSVKDGGGKVRNVSVPAHSASVEFDRVDFLAGRDPLWKQYYTSLFAEDLRVVHESTRDFLTDLASTVANDLGLIGAIPNPTLRGAIDPKDGDSILEFARRSLDGALDAALAKLRSDPSYLGLLVANLWAAQAQAVRGLVTFIEANYDELASSSAEIAVGKARLAAEIEGAAAADSDFGALDATGRANLRDAIRADVESHLWVALAHGRAKDSDLARFERVYAIATDATTPPEGGGIYQWLRSTVLGATGVLAQAGELLKAYGSALAVADDLHNTKVLLETPEPPFEFWTGDRATALARDDMREETLVVRQSPATLATTRLGDSGAWNRDALRPGDLWVDVWDPTAFARSGSPNVHWTDITQASQRPFETRWEVRVAALVGVGVATARGVRLGPDGHEPDAVSEAVRIDLSLPITVYTGWPLAHVAYRDTDTLAADALAVLQKLLDVLWPIVEPVVDWIVDAVEQFVAYLVDLVRRAMSSEVVQALYNVTRTAVELLQNATLIVLASQRASLEAMADRVRGGNFTFDLGGMHLSVTGPPDGMALTVNAWTEGVEAHAAVQFGLDGWDPREPLGLDNSPLDLLWWASSRTGDVTVTLAGDALMALQGRFVTARAVPAGGGWALEVAVPAIDAYRVWTPWEFALPLGAVTLFLGVEIHYVVSTDVPWGALLRNAFLGALDEVGFPTSLDEAGRLLQRFLERLVEGLLDFLLTGIIRIKELLFYIDGIFGAASTGAGFRIAFVVDGGFLVRILDWIAANIVEFLGSFPRPTSTAHYEAFPEDLLDFLALRIEVFGTAGLPSCLARAVPVDVPARIRIAFRVQPNLPALADYWKPELGRWRVDFGVYLEGVPAPIADALFRTGPSATPDVWFLRGAVFET